MEIPHDSPITSKDIKKRYRSKSLLIHPDKTTNPNASKAFDQLKKAESDLQTEDIKNKLDELYTQSKESLGPSATTKEIYNHFKDSLIQIEFQKRINLKTQLQRQGELDRLREESIQLDKLKREFKAQWEANQGKRVENWRSYSNKVEKKKKKKVKKVLA